MSDPDPTAEPGPDRAAPPSRRRPRTSFVVPGLVSVVALAALGFGYLLASQPWEDEPRDPLGVIRDLAAAPLSCTSVVRIADGGDEDVAVCLSTRNEILTVATFADRPDPDRWGEDLCRDDLDSVVPARGAIVALDDALVAVVAGPLSTEGGGPVPDPEGAASDIATALGGEWQRYQC